LRYQNQFRSCFETPAFFAIADGGVATPNTVLDQLSALELVHVRESRFCRVRQAGHRHTMSISGGQRNAD
jgi:hypothetical protein